MLLARWRPLLQRGSGQLAAELAGVEFLGMFRDTAADPAMISRMLLALVEQAEEHGSPEALAMLRVLAVVGPPRLRDPATEAADRLVATGLIDCPWVRALGSPAPGQCFGYTDPTGQRQTLAVVFRYGMKQHGFAVLIDHASEGGIKDCWITDRPTQMRSQYRRFAAANDLEFREYDQRETYDMLESALSRPPCPADPDQVEDIRDYLGLLRQRVGLLGARVTAAPVLVRTPRRTGVPTVHRVMITLKGSRPAIWRRVEISSMSSLRTLHECVQESFGWHDYHLWAFHTQLGEFGQPNTELGHASAASARLAAVVPRVGATIQYTYDFVDSWEHEILVEAITPAEPGVAYPRCLDGRRARPPESCGGMWGYQQLLTVLADPGHPEYEERAAWLGLVPGQGYNPAAFDLDAADAALAGFAKIVVR